MRAVFLVALLSVVAVSQTEGWWGAVTGLVGGAVDAVTGLFGKKERRRRALSEDLDSESLKKVDEVCTKAHLESITKDGINFELVKVTFEKINTEHDDALNAAELNMFLDALEVYKHCMLKVV